MYVAYTAKNAISTFQYVINTLQYMCACILKVNNECSVNQSLHVLVHIKLRGWT